jgi:nitrous oxidase accessory protein NosD
VSGSSVIEGNQIQGSPNPFSAQHITGIQLSFAQGVTIANNRILRVYCGITYGNQATGKYSRNITDDLVQVPYTGGTPVGENF